MGSHASHVMHATPPPPPLTHTHVLSHHIRAAGRAFSGWHELGLTLPPNTVAPQSLADILEQHGRKAQESYTALLIYFRAPHFSSGIISFLHTAAVNKASDGKDNKS